MAVSMPAMALAWFRDAPLDSAGDSFARLTVRNTSLASVETLSESCAPLAAVSVPAVKLPLTPPAAVKTVSYKE